MLRAKLACLCCFVVSACTLAQAQNVTENEIRPYEFTFNIVDFQHRSEKRDDDGLITGEYGFITADGIYHETAYKTDKSGDFIITKMRHRKITSLKDAAEIFKDRPEQAKMLAEAIVKSCTDCEIAELDRQESGSFVKVETTTQNVPIKRNDARLEKKLDLAMKEMMKVLNKKSEDMKTENAENPFSHKEPRKLAGFLNRSQKDPNPTAKNTTREIIRDMVDAAKRIFDSDSPEVARDDATSAELLERMASDLFYRFNFTSTSHSHWEDGFRDGRKDGEFNAKFKDGIDTHVKYTSNEFGYQPNITLVPRQEDNDEQIDIVYADSSNIATSKSRRDFNEDKNYNLRKSSRTSGRVPHRGHYFNWFRK